MRLFSILFICFITTFSYSQSDEVITVTSYNLLNFPNGRNDCGATFNVPERYDSLRKIVEYIQPDVFVACEIQTGAGADSILTRSFNVNGQSNFAMATYHNNTSGANDLQNSMYYNTEKLVLLYQDIIQTNVRDVDHYVLYVKDPNLGTHKDTAFMEVYMCHLKAGSSSADQAVRNQEAILIRDFINTRPPNRHHFLCGDLNTYRSTEACYQTLTNSGVYPLKDPINSPGNWTNNGSFSSIHTQSPRTSESLSCGSSGGMDDRFDHILVSNSVLIGHDSLKYVPGSYRAIGNDGGYFNQNLLSGTNSLYPQSLVRALYYTSDHLPVSMQVRYTYPTDFGLGLTYQQNGVVCAGENNGSVTLSPTLGVGPYVFQWDANSGFQNSATATNLEPGYYCADVTDANGKTDEICVEISENPAISGSVFPVHESAPCNGQAVVIAGGGTGPYTFLWSDPQGQTGQTASGLCAGNYTCTVTDAVGCSVVLNTTVLGFNSLNEVPLSTILSVYPNPSEDFVYLQNQSDRDYGVVEISIVNLFGQELQRLSQSFTANSKIKLDTGNLARGSYYLVVTTAVGSGKFSFVKL